MYPKKLSDLIPEYIPGLPACPADGTDTYSNAYQVSASPDFTNAYTVICEGHHHAEARFPTDFPRYTSTAGLINPENSEMMATTPQDGLKNCQRNLRNLGVALELYTTDNNGRFPTHLSALTPRYISHVFCCPSAGRDTYSSGYHWSARPDAYTLYCNGSNHADAHVTEDLPRIDSREGLFPRL